MRNVAHKFNLCRLRDMIGLLAKETCWRLQPLGQAKHRGHNENLASCPLRRDQREMLGTILIKQSWYRSQRDTCLVCRPKWHAWIYDRRDSLCILVVEEYCSRPWLWVMFGLLSLQVHFACKGIHCSLSKQYVEFLFLFFWKYGKNIQKCYQVFVSNLHEKNIVYYFLWYHF